MAMNIDVDKLGVRSPVVLERQCGGWIARSPEGARLQIAVTALTEAEVRAQFSLTADKWIATLQMTAHP